MAKTQKGKSEKIGEMDLNGGEFSTFALEDAEDNRVMKSSLWAAAGLHILLLLINFPAYTSEPLAAEKEKKIFVIQQHRFKPPPPPVEQEIPRQKPLRVPIPDPSPDEPEPLRIDEPTVELDLPEVDLDHLPLPSAPPPEEPRGPIPVGGDVIRPEKTYAPQPQYTEIARKARIEGVVIVQAIINKQGDVTNVKVLKGLPMGLSEEAVKAIKKWKFKSATLNAKPVDVYYNLTVHFNLQ